MFDGQFFYIQSKTPYVNTGIVSFSKLLETLQSENLLVSNRYCTAGQ
jgi:hypothetical protein